MHFDKACLGVGCFSSLCIKDFWLYSPVLDGGGGLAFGRNGRMFVGDPQSSSPLFVPRVGGWESGVGLVCSDLEVRDVAPFRR